MREQAGRVLCGEMTAKVSEWKGSISSVWMSHTAVIAFADSYRGSAVIPLAGNLVLDGAQPQAAKTWPGHLIGATPWPSMRIPHCAQTVLLP